MLANSKRRQFSRRPSVVGTLSKAAGLLMSVGLVVVMTVWATSSPFSPLSPQEDVETVSEPLPMLQKVKDVFAVSDEVLPGPAVDPKASESPIESLPLLPETNTYVSEPIESDELAQLEKKYALQQEDRTAWRTFKRQAPLLATEPIVRAFELPPKEQWAMEATELPEVHFASENPRPILVKTDQAELTAVLPLQIKSGLSIANGADTIKKQGEVPPGRIATEPPARVATLPIGDQYIAPFGRENIATAPAILPTVSQKKSWETGRY